MDINFNDLKDEFDEEPLFKDEQEEKRALDYLKELVEEHSQDLYVELRLAMLDREKFDNFLDNLADDDKEALIVYMGKKLEKYENSEDGE